MSFDFKDPLQNPELELFPCPGFCIQSNLFFFQSETFHLEIAHQIP